jgi:hypothetical protein
LPLDEQNSPVIVLGHRIWKSRFNCDPNMLGKSIALSGHSYTVIGIAPPYFRGIDLILAVCVHGSEADGLDQQKRRRSAVLRQEGRNKS